MTDTTICGECFERIDECDCVELPRLSYTADEMAAVVAERDRLRQFVALIRDADRHVITTTTASMVRMAIKWLDEQETA